MGGYGWVHPKGANSMAVSELCGRKVFADTGIVSAPDPNQPQRGSLPVSRTGRECDTGSDPCWGWFGSGTETSTGRAISITFGINELRNQLSCLVGAPFPVFSAHFSATAGWHFLGDLIGRLLICGCG